MSPSGLSIGRVAAELGPQILAEGAKWPEEVEMLHAAAGDLFQSYYFFKPLPAREFPVGVERLNDSATDRCAQAS